MLDDHVCVLSHRGYQQTTQDNLGPRPCAVVIYAVSSKASWSGNAVKLPCIKHARCAMKYAHRQRRQHGMVVSLRGTFFVSFIYNSRHALCNKYAASLLRLSCEFAHARCPGARGGRLCSAPKRRRRASIRDKKACTNRAGSQIAAWCSNLRRRSSSSLLASNRSSLSRMSFCAQPVWQRITSVSCSTVSATETCGASLKRLAMNRCPNIGTAVQDGCLGTALRQKRLHV